MREAEEKEGREIKGGWEGGGMQGGRDAGREGGWQGRLLFLLRCEFVHAADPVQQLSNKVLREERKDKKQQQL